MKKQTLKSIFPAIALFIALIAFNSCSSNNNNAKSPDSAGSDEIVILGAGSSFDYPLFSKMFHEYYTNNGVKVNYQSVGSGAGISQLTHKTVDFGASDAPMKATQESDAGAPVIHIPVTAGAVTITYNLPGFDQTLQLSPKVLADIFMGKITKWDDANIQAVNPGVKLPTTAIVVAHRSDGSGTTSIFTDYLSKVNDDWKNKVGAGTAVSWPIGLGGKGNEGVAGLVRQTPGAIGYVELAYAIQNKMPYAEIQNQAGKFIKPSIESVTAAANVDIPADGKVLLTNTSAPEGYPIAGFSWVIIYQEQHYGNNTKAKAETLVKLLNWMIHDGQQYSADLDYAPLSETAVTVGTNLLKTVTFDGQPLLIENK